jgi:hypothetical protein
MYRWVGGWVGKVSKGKKKYQVRGKGGLHNISNGIWKGIA